MLTLVRRQPQQPRARFAPRSSPRFARRPPVRLRTTAIAPGALVRRPRSPPMHHASQSASATARDFRALPVRVPALVRRSCGARPHFARHCLAQCAPHRRPLNRRGGSDPPGSPASIFRSFIQRESTYPTGRAGLGFHTPRSRLQGGRMRPLRVPFADLRRLWPPGFCWSERMSHRYTPIIVALTAQGGACRTPTYGRNATEHGINTDRYTTDIRLTTRTPPPLAAFATDGHARAARPNADSATSIEAARFPISRLVSPFGTPPATGVLHHASGNGQHACNLVATASTMR